MPLLKTECRLVEQRTCTYVQNRQGLYCSHKKKYCHTIDIPIIGTNSHNVEVAEKEMFYSHEVPSLSVTFTCT